MSIPFAGIESVALQDASVVILPIPYGATLSYMTGAAQGPMALLMASMQIETFDEELQQDIAHIGLHTLPPVDIDLSCPEAMHRAIHDQALVYGNQGCCLIAIGGEHSITSGLVKARQTLTAEPFSLLQIDAHADLRASYQGTRWSHACVMRRIFDYDIPCVRVGIRSLSAAEWLFIHEQQLISTFFWAHDIVPAAKQGNHDWMDRLIEMLLPSVYITIDMDGFDPSVVPAVGTPEPGGLDYYTVLRLLRLVYSKCTVIGCDINELSPIPGQPASDFLAAKLVYKMISYRHHLSHG
ncbi:MAG: agmatinase [Magnetococcales bacterium]|nr:agmatinase [Magnetococcales bacterium]